MDKLIDAMKSTGFQMEEGTVAKPRLVLYRVRPVEGDRLITNSLVHINENLTLAKCDLVTFTAKCDDYMNDAMLQMTHWCIDQDWKWTYITNEWWKVDVATERGAMFDSNGMLYLTYDLAQEALLDLLARWTAPCHAQVRPASRYEVAGALLKTAHGPNPSIVRGTKDTKR